MRISDWSSDVCSSDLHQRKRDCRAAESGRQQCRGLCLQPGDRHGLPRVLEDHAGVRAEGAAHEQPVDQQLRDGARAGRRRSEEHTSELQSLMRISYAVFCLKKKKNRTYELTVEHRYKTRITR